MAKLTKYIKNPYTKKFVRIEANSFDELMNHEKLQIEAWDKSNGTGLLSNNYVVKKSMESHKEILKMYSEIVVRNLSNTIDYANFYKKINEEDSKLVFEPRMKKPNKEILFDKLSVPKKMPIIEKLKRDSFDRRVKAEIEAQKIFDKLLFEYEKHYKTDLSSFEEKDRARLADIRNQNSEIDSRRSKFLKKDKHEVELILQKIFESKKYIDNKIVASKKYNLNFNYKPKDELVFITRQLPNITDLPTHSELRWNDIKKKVDKINWEKSDLIRLHEDVTSQLILITIYDIFCSIPSDIISKVFFKGYFDNLDVDKENKTHKTISIYVTRDYFMSIDLMHCDYRACISNLQGIKKPDFVEIFDYQTNGNIQSNAERITKKKKILDAQNSLSETSNIPVKTQQDELNIDRKQRKTTKKDNLESSTRHQSLRKNIQESVSITNKKTRNRNSEDSRKLTPKADDYQKRTQGSVNEFNERPKRNAIANGKTKNKKALLVQESSKIIKNTNDNRQTINTITKNLTYSAVLNKSQSKTDMDDVSKKRKVKKRIKPDFDLDFED